MSDQSPIKEQNAVARAAFEPEFIFHIPGAFPVDDEPVVPMKRDPTPACRLRYGRGGRCYLEARRKRPFGQISAGVVSDSDSDEEGEDYYPVDPQKVFDYRCATNMRTRPEATPGHRSWPSGDLSAMVAAAQATGSHPPNLQQQASGGSAS